MKKQPGPCEPGQGLIVKVLKVGAQIKSLIEITDASCSRTGSMVLYYRIF